MVKNEVFDNCLIGNIIRFVFVLSFIASLLAQGYYQLPANFVVDNVLFSLIMCVLFVVLQCASCVICRVNQYVGKILFSIFRCASGFFVGDMLGNLLGFVLFQLIFLYFKDVSMVVFVVGFGVDCVVLVSLFTLKK